jgi:hypothetical protein
MSDPEVCGSDRGLLSGNKEPSHMPGETDKNCENPEIDSPVSGQRIVPRTSLTRGRCANYSTAIFSLGNKRHFNVFYVETL